MERKNTNQCLGGIRVEYQGVQNPQTFLVKNFSLIRRKSMTIGALSSEFW